MIFTEAEAGKKLTEYLNTGKYKKILLPCWHGVGDIVMFAAPLKALRKKYPNIHIDVGLAKGLQEEKIIPDAVLLEADWREKINSFDYDLVFSCNMPLEDLKNTSKTKAEICCEQELGIEPISGHLPISIKKIAGVHFHNTAVSWLANADEEVAGKIWQEIIDADYVPVELLFKHAFYNETSKKYAFTDNHVRYWPARLDTLIALLGACDKFIGVVSGNFHLALSILGPEKVMLLEKDLKAGHFTKLKIATADIKNYKDGEIKEWLQNTLT